MPFRNGLEAHLATQLFRLKYLMKATTRFNLDGFLEVGLLKRSFRFGLAAAKLSLSQQKGHQ